jgi:hypothetical protein
MAPPDVIARQENSDTEAGDSEEHHRTGIAKNKSGQHAEQNAQQAHPKAEDLKNLRHGGFQIAGLD